MGKRIYEKDLDNSSDTEPVVCFHCREVKMAHFTGKTVVQRVYALPEGWEGNIMDASCQKCVKIYHTVDQYRRDWTAIQNHRLKQMKERALRYA